MVGVLAWRSGTKNKDVAATPEVGASGSGGSR